MESTTFDKMVSRLCTGASRRQMLRGLVGTVAAAMAGGATLQATAKSAGQKRRRGPAGGPATAFVAVCHVTAGDKDPERIRVRRRALRAHLAHGDFRYHDCCVNDDCDVPECFTAQCVHGTCSQTQLPPGAPCTYGAGAIGNCTADAQCLPTATGGG